MRPLSVSLLLCCLPAVAQAYIGPGAGLGAITVVIAFALGFFLLFMGVLWYPLKRLLRGKKAGAKDELSSSAAAKD